MAFFIDFDGKTVYTYTCTQRGIRLDNGRCWPDRDVKGRLFAVKPEDNRNLELIDGVWHYRGESLKAYRPREVS